MLVEEREEEEVVEVNGLSECEGRDGSDRGDWDEEMLEKMVGEGEEEGEGEGEGEGEEKEEDEDGEEKEDDEDEDKDDEGEGEEREEGEKRKGWMRETKEENEGWEMEKEAGIGEWACGRRLFGVEKRGKERMAGWWVMREKFVREREAWAERKRGQWWWWWLLLSEGG
ncbi:uncharacterized protein MONOS_16949 [Monocercomonoides exilis]|uniref:uncharacterized protein n=1 Tax=Monocercomonoides exilis TaxID=2049356 RepID=UPI00355A22EE|nr:hypothetical protein MONOS_16949 [Monocercomonoides exilis]